MRAIACISTLLIGLCSAAICKNAIAQVTSDNTTNTIVNSNGNNFTILNGIENGNNLFHSFSNFSVPTGGSASFDLSNTPNITTIFSRVTGGNISQIDGLIRTFNSNNSVSLFLMNPNGIVFGPNARLNISGSFVGTTANSIKFADGTELSAVQISGTPLLTMSVPIGLQMGKDSGNIQVQGYGHQLTGGVFTPVIRSNNKSTLEVNSGKAIALIGENVNLSGGVLRAENGRIELGAVQAGTVNINSTFSDLQLDYTSIESFGDIQFANRSLVDASGLTSRGIQLQGKNISLQDGSVALIQTIGRQAPYSLRVLATGVLDLSGDVRTAPDLGPITGVISSRLMTESLIQGKGADIDVSVGDLRLNHGGSVGTQTFGLDSAGNINVNVARDIQIHGTALLNPIIPSGILTNTFSSKPSGDMNISASNITITDGGLINSINFAQGDTGNINLNVTGTIEIKGIDSRILSTSNIGSSVFGQGNAGYLNLNTSKLIIENGASVSTATFNSGAGGTIIINASESIKVRGSSPNGERNSSISASAPITPIAFRQSLKLPERPSGNAGSLTINTPTLHIDNGAKVSVNNEGLGNGGILNINGTSLLLNNNGHLIANTASGEGGNINLNLKSDLILRNNSFISTEAKGNGNGGNLSINAPIIFGLKNSDIIANAVQGKGGNIDITTQGIIGLEFSETLTPRVDLTNDITASSAFNVNGTVEINHVGVDPNSGLIELPGTLTDPSQKIATGCSVNPNSKFVVTGRDRIPTNPTYIIESYHPWIDMRDMSAYFSTEPVQAQISPSPQVFVQATSWHRNAKGKIELVASRSSIEAQQPLTCAGIAQK